MTYQKAITDAVTGETEIVDLSAEELADLQARQAQVATEAAAKVEAETVITETVDALPTAAEIEAAKTVADLKAINLKLLAVIELLVGNAGLKA